MAAAGSAAAAAPFDEVAALERLFRAEFAPAVRAHGEAWPGVPPKGPKRLTAAGFRRYLSSRGAAAGQLERMVKARVAAKRAWAARARNGARQSRATRRARRAAPRAGALTVLHAC
jgi:hypothetical protein